MLRLNSLQLGGRGGSKEGGGGRPVGPRGLLHLSQGRPGRNSTQPGHQHQDLFLKGHGHLDVESLLSSITHLRCVQASQNADNDHGAPGYAGAASSFVYRCQISEKYSSTVNRVSQCTLYYPRMHNFVHFLTTTY